MIKEFFEDKEIFITGGSGVVGKALVEKLLRSCNVRKIYILLRSKKHESIEERFKELKNTMISSKRSNVVIENPNATEDVFKFHFHLKFEQLTSFKKNSISLRNFHLKHKQKLH